MKSQKELRRKLRNKPITMTRKEIDRMKLEATEKAVEIAAFTDVWVLRTKYGFGEKRIKEFMQHRRELFDSLEKGYLTLADIEKRLKKEVGITTKKSE